MATLTNVITNATGNVGIGTNSPSTNLHIGGTAASGGANGGLGVFLSRGVTTNFFEAFDGTKSFIAGVDNTQGFAKVGTFSNHPVSITQNNGSAIYIDTSKNVGIGTTSPAYILDIVGSSPKLRVKDTGTSYSTLEIESNNAGGFQFAIDNSTGTGFGGTAYAGTIYKQGAYPIAIWTNAVERMRITPYGDVGIGTTNPSVKLAVEGGSIATVNITGSDVKLSFDIRALVGGAIGFNNAAASNVYGAVTGSAYFGVAQSYPIVFTTAGTERMRILSGGNVGIGSTSPNAALDVNGSIHLNGNIRNSWGNNLFNVAQYPFNSSTSPDYYMGFQTEASTRIFYISNRNNDGSATDPNGGIIFRTGGTPTNRMLISYSGNVGIGTTAPASKLHISGSGQTIMRLDSSTTTNISQYMVKANTDGVLIMGMSGGSAASTNFGVTAAGQAFIGTTTLSTIHPTSLVIGTVSTNCIQYKFN